MKKIITATLSTTIILIIGIFVANNSTVKSYDVSFTTDNLKMESNSLTYTTIDNGYGYVTENNDSELSDAVKGTEEPIEEYEFKSMDAIPQAFRDESYKIVKAFLRDNNIANCLFTDAVINANTPIYHVCIDGNEIEICFHQINKSNSQEMTMWYSSDFTDIQNYSADNNVWLYGLTTDCYDNAFYIAASRTDNYFITVKISSDNRLDVEKIVDVFCKI